MVRDASLRAHHAEACDAEPEGYARRLHPGRNVSSVGCVDARARNEAAACAVVEAVASERGRWTAGVRARAAADR